MIKHECSVAAISSLGPDFDLRDSVFSTTVGMLLDMQTRGQLAAGISTYAPDRSEPIKTYKNIGSVDRVFDLSQPDNLRQIKMAYDGPIAIGHTRYATTGGDDRRYAQPVERRHGQLWKWFAFAFNGTLSNYTHLRDKLSSEKGFHFVLDSDTEVIEHYIAYSLRGDQMPELETVIREATEYFDGAYCIVMIDAIGRMLVARDPLGLRPLNWAEQNDMFAAASESSALQNAGFEKTYTVEPGEAIIVQNGNIERVTYAKTKHRAHCFFEWVYFANVASSIDGKGVYESRTAAGKMLAEKEDVPVDQKSIVVPVPDTAKAAADSFAFQLGIPCVEGIFRNRFIGRTFIQAENTRQDAAKRKYTPLPSVLRGMKVFLIEDSIVRSNTLRALVSMIRTRCQPKEIHVRVACPPIVAPCFYGIDLSTLEELFAAGFADASSELEQGRMAKLLRLDSLRYLQTADIANCIGIDQNELCTGCISGAYPTAAGAILYKEAKRRKSERNGENA